MRQRTRDPERLPGRQQAHPPQRERQRLDRVRRQPGDVRDRLVPDPAAVPDRPADQMRHVLPIPMPTPDLGHMHTTPVLAIPSHHHTTPDRPTPNSCYTKRAPKGLTPTTTRDQRRCDDINCRVTSVTPRRPPWRLAGPMICRPSSRVCRRPIGPISPSPSTATIDACTRSNLFFHRVTRSTGFAPRIPKAITKLFFRLRPLAPRSASCSAIAAIAAVVFRRPAPCERRLDARRGGRIGSSQANSAAAPRHATTVNWWST